VGAVGGVIASESPFSMNSQLELESDRFHVSGCNRKLTWALFGEFPLGWVLKPRKWRLDDVDLAKQRRSVQLDSRDHTPRLAAQAGNSQLLLRSLRLQFLLAVQMALDELAVGG
jgi:hypothetical protein